jgi:hypothetical protein
MTGATVAYAYFCAKCKHDETDPALAARLAERLGVTLWRPADRVTYDFPAGALACRDAIVGAGCVICQPPIGNDCSWELGYAIGIGKRVYVIGTLPGDDWMTRIGVEYVDPALLKRRAEPDVREAVGR